ncbi:cell division protein FtsX [Microbaculum marinisediminis]|uniref:ABC transporter permease n=1 Tax=Microbaculum marinisediminis TaxID=2931392 RepID=A0AAW5R073_9HYPH|nr:ABC transporter permease [Microbaculum sp. A6E488]MCT8972263.1 ABC transporter permease [Microbaculum sp. A6E488]
MALPAERDDLNDETDRSDVYDGFGPAAAIVPASGVSGRALFFVLAIMSFLACITVGTVTVIASAAADWRSDISGEITVQIRPLDGVDTLAAIDKALAVILETDGIESARALSEQELRDLLEPWLGAGVDLEELPVPRLIVVEIDRAAPPDFVELRQRLTGAVPAASLDDHQLWQGRLAVMANTLAVSGAAILVLVLVATVLSVVFATRGAMATNRDIVEVLHLVGAKEAFIAHEFERHFLRLGFRGGLAGGIAATIAFAAIRWISAQFTATPAGDQFDALFGGISIGWAAFVGIALTVLLVAALTAMSSRLTVFHFLKVFD